MNETSWLAARFEADRARLRALAYRMLGSAGEADDAVQEAWLRLHRTDAQDIENLGGWLTTVVARVCLDVLRARKARREEALDDTTHAAQPAAGGAHIDPEREAQLADSVGLALLVVLDRLTPAERIAFVLHDMFDLSFDDIAPIVERSPAATRQLASRARRRVRGATPSRQADRAEQRRVVDAFLAASRQGDLQGLLAVLAPDVVFRPDATAARMGRVSEIRGAPAVADTFKGRAAAAQLALIDGAVGLMVAPAGRLLLVLRVTIADGKVVSIDAVADPDQLQRLDLAALDDT